MSWCSGGVLSGPRGVGRYAYGALGAAALLLALSLALPVMVLGSGFAEQFRYPILAVTGTVTFLWFPFQRLTTLVALIWQIVVYVVLAFYLWSGTYVLSAACGSRNWRLWLLPAAAATAYFGGVNMGLGTERMLADTWNFAVVVIGVMAPALLWMAAVLRRRAGVKAR